MASAAGRFRQDIEGLRGFAIALVVVFHVFVGKVSSGVDVFLLLGGIFFFGSQLSNARNPKGLTIVQSVIRIIRRLFPPLAIVVAATLVAAILTMNKLVWVQMAKDAVAALGYFINWQLAFSGRDYVAIQTTVSPFQHLWSMSAQLQIYLASLLAVVVIAFIFRRLARPVLVVILSAATILSFAYATWQHGQDQALNYYSTFSRFWEIGLGGLVGMILLKRDKQGNPAMRPLGPWARRILGVVGILLIALTGVFLNGSDQFPGAWTLVPLSGAVLVVIAGSSGQPVGVTRVMESRPMVELGGISYSLYLWHWPLLVLALNWSGQPKVSWALGLGVIAASLVLAWLTKMLVEKPLRQAKKPARSWVLTSPSYVGNSLKVWPKTVYALVIIVVAGAVVASPPILEKRLSAGTDQLLEASSDRAEYPGALSFINNAPTPEGKTIVPPLEDFHKLLPPTQPDGCQIGFEPAVLVLTKNYNRSQEQCAYGDVNSKRTLYAVGGSHTEHYMPALDIVGKRQGIKVIPLLKMGCPINANITLYNGQDYPSCREWSKTTMDYIAKNPPTEGIFMPGTRPSDTQGNGPEVIPPEYVDTVRTWHEAGIKTWLIRDNPWHMRTDGSGPLDMRQCVVGMMEGNWNGPGAEGFSGVADPEHPTFDEVLAINRACGTPVNESLLPEDPSIKAYQGLNVKLMDLTAAICREGWCPAIIGNMAAYRDAHHFTNVFAETLAGEMEAQMFDPNHKIPRMDISLEEPEQPVDENGSPLPSPGAPAPGQPGSGIPAVPGQPGAPSIPGQPALPNAKEPPAEVPPAAPVAPAVPPAEEQNPGAPGAPAPVPAPVEPPR